MCGKYPSVYPSQTWIGSQTNNCRQTINESIKILKDEGLVKATYRHKQTCIYQLDPIFGSPKFRLEFSHILPALKKFSIILYFSYMATLNYRQNINISSLITLESKNYTVPAPKFLNTTQKGENLTFNNKSISTLPTCIASVLHRSDDDAFFRQPTYTPPTFQGYKPMYTTSEQKMYDIKKMTVAPEDSLIYKQAAAQQRAIDCAPPVKKEPVILSTPKQLAFAAMLQGLK